jgi:hypothetical protein
MWLFFQQKYKYFGFLGEIKELSLAKFNHDGRRSGKLVPIGPSN